MTKLRLTTKKLVLVIRSLARNWLKNVSHLGVIEIYFLILNVNNLWVDSVSQLKVVVVVIVIVVVVVYWRACCWRGRGRCPWAWGWRRSWRHFHDNLIYSIQLRRLIEAERNSPAVISGAAVRCMHFTCISVNKTGSRRTANLNIGQLMRLFRMRYAAQ